MRISHKHKFIFLSKPRCASTTIRLILDPFSDVLSSSTPPFHHHTTALVLKTYFDKAGWKWEDYFVFTTVRNPWEMIVSYYTFFKPDINGLYNFEQKRDGFYYQPDKLATFNDWVISATTYHRLAYLNGDYIYNSWVKGFSKLTLSNTINDANGISLVNRILKVEEIRGSLTELLNSLGIYSKNLQSHLNNSNHSNYHDYYTSKTKEVIEKQFAADIYYGKYEF